MTPDLHPNIALPADAQLGEFVVLGAPPRGFSPGALPLVIGTRCVIHSHTVIYAGSRIGERFETGHGVVIREETIIGDDVSIGTHSVVEHHVVIGDGVRLHTGVFVPEYSVLEAGCWLGPGVCLTNARYPRSEGVKARLAGVIIERDAILGASTVLLPGVRVGARALVGAGAVVAGNLARVINRIENILYYSER